MKFFALVFSGVPWDQNQGIFSHGNIFHKYTKF